MRGSIGSPEPNVSQKETADIAQLLMKVELKPQAIKDLQSIHKKDAARIVARLGELEAGLTGDIKRLTSFTPEYRLRVGNYRVLFEVEGGTVIIYRVMHRKHVYAKR
jgi:mRNA interferase RelE/StbE